MSSAMPQAEIRELQLDAPLRARLFPNNEWVLVVVLLVECGIFSLTGNNFLSASNAFEITRLSVEIGLLALALTPIIITGGVDLSVGSMVGAAGGGVGGLWREAPLAMAAAGGVYRLARVVGGSVHALIV